MATGGGPVTASELLRELEADPEWRVQRNAKAAATARRGRAFSEEQAELLSDLRGVGVNVSSVWEVSTAEPCAAALPVLLRHLLLPYSPQTRDGIARALAVRAARSLAWDAMLALLYDRTLPNEVAGGIMTAISAMAGPADLSLLFQLLSDKRLGRPRILLIPKLMRSKRPEARQALIENRDDPELQAEINYRLKLAHRTGL